MDTPLPPHLQRFLYEQLATGRFATEADVIRAALNLMQERSSGSRLGNAPVHAAATPADTIAPRQAGRRSPRAILADLKSHITPDEIREARSEMWAGFPRRDV